MATLQDTEKNKHFRSTNIELLARISNYFYQYYLKDGKVKVSVLSIPSDGRENMIISYIQFNPDEIDLEARLFRTSVKVYNIHDQLFMLLKGTTKEIMEKVKMSIAYIGASIE